MKGRAINYNDLELEFISNNRTLVIGDLHAAFCKKFHRSDVTVKLLFALKKRKGWKTGRTGRFEKGNVPPPTAGSKGPNKTSFRPGNKPENCQPIGTERLSKDGYIEIKTNNGQGRQNWIKKHTAIWESVNGATPSNKYVSFIDSNKRNFALENLEILSRNEGLQINRLGCSELPPVLRIAARATGKLMARTKAAERRIAPLQQARNN